MFLMAYEWSKEEYEELERQNRISDAQWSAKVEEDIRNGHIDEPLAWEDEEDYVKRILEDRGIYTVELGAELENMIRDLYGEGD